MDFAPGNSGRPVAPVPPAPRQTSEQPQAAHRPPAHQPRKSKKKLISIIAAVLVAAVLALGALYFLNSRGNNIDSGKYQAVFFTNGQVYFGKLHQGDADTMKLTDVFYLQADQAAADSEDSKNPQATSGDQAANNLQLIKLGNEIHGPLDEMIINRDQVLFYENLKPEGKVSQSIKQYVEKK